MWCSCRGRPLGLSFTCLSLSSPSPSSVLHTAYTYFLLFGTDKEQQRLSVLHTPPSDTLQIATTEECWPQHNPTPTTRCSQTKRKLGNLNSPSSALTVSVLSPFKACSNPASKPSRCVCSLPLCPLASWPEPAGCDGWSALHGSFPWRRMPSPDFHERGIPLFGHLEREKPKTEC